LVQGEHASTQRDSAWQAAGVQVQVSCFCVTEQPPVPQLPAWLQALQLHTGQSPGQLASFSPDSQVRLLLQVPQAALLTHCESL
jgi:hypothetical protein